MRLNDEQRPAALEHDRHLLLSAGAGSGKTRVLVARYVQILKDAGWAAEMPARILAITFTDKAAQEMQDRVFRALEGESVSADAELVLKLRRLERELESAPISTIHGFCSRLLRENAAEAGIDPRFRVPDAVELYDLRQENFDALFESSDEDLLLLAGEFGVDKLMDGLIEHRDLRRSLGLPMPDPDRADELAESQLAFALEMQKTRWSDWLSGLPERFAALCEHLPSGRHPMEKQQAKIDTALAILSAANREDPRPEIAEALVDAMKGFRKSIDDDGRLAGKWEALQKEIKESAGPLSRLNAPTDDSPGPQGMRAAFFRLMTRFDAAFTSGMAERSWLDFEDLQLAALALLETRPTLRESLRRQFRHVLVDEFQDTNRLQLRLIRCLIDERDDPASRALFLVGDHRQSIYSFRNADLEVFRAEESRLKKLDRQRSLSFNFRSHPELLAFFNGHFPEDEFPKMKSEEDPEGPPRVLIQLRAMAGRKSGPTRRESAEALADLLLRAHDEGLLVGKEEKEHPLEWGDVAILVRSGQAIEPLTRSLAARGIPYEAAGGREYFLRQELLDLEDLIIALDDPYQRLKLTRGLSGGVIGLGAADLLALMPPSRGRRDKGRGSDLMERLRAAAAAELKLSPEGRAKTALFLRLREKLGRSLTRLPLRRLIPEIVEASGFDLKAAADPQGLKTLRNLRQLADLVGELESHRRLSVREFLDHMARIREVSPKREEAWVPEEGESLVRILTIHSAKGLEYPLVVLADLDRDIRGVQVPGDLASLRGGTDRDEPEAFFGVNWRDEEGESRADAVHDWIRGEKIRREEAESLRLLYVAMTRAEDYLVLSGIYSGKDGESAKDELHRPFPEPGKNFLSALRAGLGGVEEKYYRVDTPGETPSLGPGKARAVSASAPEKRAADWDGLFVDLKLRGKLELPVTGLTLLQACPLRWSLEKRAGLSGAFSRRGDPFHSDPADPDASLSGASFGTLLHGILEDWDFRASAEDAFELACPADLDTPRREAAREILHAFFAEKNVWTQRRLPEGADLRREESFVLQLGDLHITGQIDLHFLWEGQRYLVDWKSDQLSAETIADRVEHHSLQMRLYALALREAGRPVAGAFLGFLRDGGFREVAIDEHHLKSAEKSVADLSGQAMDLSGSRELPRPQKPPCSGCPWREGPCTREYRSGQAK